MNALGELFGVCGCLDCAVGAQNGAYKLAREGVVFLKFTHAIGTRQYDWQNSKVS